MSARKAVVFSFKSAFTTAAAILGSRLARAALILAA
jgi:hypothetical protein